MNKVTVAADKNGNVIGISPNNPEYGWIRVEQNARVINDRGWLRNSKRSALIKGKVEDLLAANYRDGEEITGGTSGAKGTVDKLSTSNQHTIPVTRVSNLLKLKCHLYTS